MVEHGAAADNSLPPRLVGGVENPAVIDVKVQPGAVGDPLPGLAVVQRRGPARQLHRGPEYLGIHQRIRHDQSPVLSKDQPWSTIADDTRVIGPRVRVVISSGGSGV